MAELAYKSALIVGAGQGLSGSVAKLFVGHGLKVTLAARSVDDLAPLVKEIGCDAFACDASDAAQVAKLKSKVQGNEYLLMSPYPGLDSPISLQAWGFQLKVKNADDSRITDFITDLKKNAAIDASTSCATGTYVTGTGSTPFDLGSPAPAPSASASTSPSATASATPAP